jgi:hypothetical protein
MKKRERAIISAFLSTLLICTGCGLISSEDVDAVKNNQQSQIDSFKVASMSDVTLKDKNDANFTVTKNENGTATASYEDGKEVTFKVDNKGNMVYISGDKDLMDNIGTSYLSYLGFDTNSIVADNNGSYSNNDNNHHHGGGFIPFSTGFGSGYLMGSLMNSGSGSGTRFSSGSKPSPTVAKSGFSGSGGRTSMAS